MKEWRSMKYDYKGIDKLNSDICNMADLGMENMKLVLDLTQDHYDEVQKDLNKIMFRSISKVKDPINVSTYTGPFGISVKFKVEE